MPITPLATIKPPDMVDFDRDSFVDEVIERIKLHPDWQRLWDGELFQNANQMILHMFGYMFEKNAESFDRKSRENFLLSARSDEGIAYNLQEMQVDIKQNEAAQITLECTSDVEITEDFTIPRTSIETIDNNGTAMTFEIIAKDSNNQYDYLNNISISYDANLNPGVFRTTAYAGETSQYEEVLDADNLENFSLTLPSSPIIDDSVVVYYYNSSSGTYTLLREVKTFDTDEEITATFPFGKPMYQLSYNLDQQAVLTFGSSTAGGRFYDDHIGNSLMFFYRTGGGQATNIGNETIDTTISLIIDPNEGYSSVGIVNITEGSGGKDYETIEEAKLYAPLRRGRDRAIVDKFDAYDALNGIIAKHKIKNPSYEDEHADIVPLLHTYHYLVPLRDSYGENTDLIDVDTEYLESVELFTTAFIELLNDYLNVQGLHETVTDEVIRSSFKTKVEESDNSYDILYTLDNLNVLSGSLYLNAYNHSGEVIDTIKWTGNYPQDLVLNNVQETEPATVSTNELGVLTITENSNDTLEIKFDNVNNLFSYTFNPGANLPEEMATLLQNFIISEITSNTLTSLYPYIYHTFVSWDSDNHKIVFTSPTSGTSSKVKFTASATGAQGLLTTLGLTAKTYTSSLATGSVFKSTDSLFSYDTSELKIIINNDEIEDQIQTFSLVATQDTTQATGPVLELQLYDTDLQQTTALQDNQSTDGILVTFYNDSSLVDQCKFILDGNEEVYAAEVSGVTTNAIISTTYTDSTLTVDTSEFNLAHLDGEAVDTYSQAFEDITKIEVWKTNESSAVSSLVGTHFPESTWYQDTTTSDGPRIIIDGINFSDGDNYDYSIKIYGTGNVLLQTAIFDQSVAEIEAGLIAADSIANPAINSTRMVTETSETIEYFYGPTGTATSVKDSTVDLSPQQLFIVCKDGTIDATTTYEATFADYDSVTIQYYREIYDTIKTSYVPNPYQPEGEALTYMAKLNAKEKRIIGLENVIKAVTFTPIKLSLELYIKDSSLSAEAKDYVFYTLHEYFDFYNINENHKIGENITLTDIINIIMPNAGTYGITNLTLSDTTQAWYTANTIEEDEYRFLLDIDMVTQLKTLEETYPALSGLSNEYSLTINIKIQDS